MESLFSAIAPTSDILTEKYRPHHIAGFIGLEKPRRIAAKLASNPPSKGGLLFLGEPGIGKTTLALAIAKEIPAELHHIASQDCNIERLFSRPTTPKSFRIACCHAASPFNSHRMANPPRLRSYWSACGSQRHRRARPGPILRAS